jgi:DNA-directed RNA polymerase specialized sigma24 family protein
MNTTAISSLQQKLIYSLAYNFFGSSEDAHFIVQETCQRWSAVPEKETRNVKTELIRIAANLCMDYARDVVRA